MGDIDPYLKDIPEHNRWKLNKELDFDNELDRDLIEIATHIHNWLVALRVPLGLTQGDVTLIKHEQDPVLKL